MQGLDHTIQDKIRSDNLSWQASQQAASRHREKGKERGDTAEPHKRVVEGASNSSSERG